MSSREKRMYNYKRSDIQRYAISAGKIVSSSSPLADVLSYMEHEQRGQTWSRQFHKASLYKCEDSSCHSAEPFSDEEDLLRYLEMLLVQHSHMNISMVVSLEMKKETIDIEYDVPKYSLHDVLAYSPAALKGSLSKVEFIIYQLLQCQQYLHSNGATLGRITLKDVYIDENFWISVCPKLNCQPVAMKQPAEKQAELKAETASTDHSGDGGLSAVTERWVHGDMSNFEYLSYINSCCGREIGHPNHHPVLPWIMDFSQPFGGWRDLTKSKFRINKGDDQLDQTYEVAQAILAEQHEQYGDVHAAVVPHHISDVLSDITYYTYNARRTPKEVLCQHVRQKWVPHEYPSSIKRLQEWTPDECIPEFFTDPNIFMSIHDDMPDLELPAWAESVEDFIEKHRNALESDYVSQHLHHWIDLTFGYKLSGEAAVEARNVCLALVNGHTNYTDHGIVQLFTKPHPERVCVTTKYISARAPDIFFKERLPQQLPSATAADGQEGFSDSAEFDDLVKSTQSLSAELIQLPPDFDPMHLLDRIEKNVNTRPITETCGCHVCPYHNDTLYVGCLMAKIILPDETRLITDMTCAPLNQMAKRMASLVVKNKYIIPRALYQLLAAALQIRDKSERRLTCTYNLPPVNPGLLIAPSVLPFPTYFHSLHEVISYHLLTDSLCTKRQLSCEGNSSSADLQLMLKERLNFHERFISEHGSLLQEEGLVLYLPHVKQLMELADGDQCVQAAWYLFGQLSQVLGPKLSIEHLSPALLTLYSREDISEMKKIKLYHKAFLQQLVMQLGLSHFIESYTSQLVLALCSSSAIHASSTRADAISAKEQVATEETGLDLASILVESLIWLSRRVGPLLTAKYFTSRILQTMKDCYSSPVAFTEPTGEGNVLTSKTCHGDVLLSPAITCLQEIAVLYGEQFLLLQYIPAIRRVVVLCDTTDLEPSSPASLISCATLLFHIVPCLPESKLLDLLEVKVIGEILLPLINIVSCPCYTFPSTDLSQSGVACRRFLAFRILDIFILVGQRIGYDQTRRYLRRALHAFFSAFEVVHGEEGVWTRHHEGKSDTRGGDDYTDIKQSSVDANEFYVGTPVSVSPESTSVPKREEVRRTDTADDVITELAQVFNAELAHRAYIQCCRLAGSHYIHQLSNDITISRLYTQHEQETGLHYKRHIDTPSNSVDVDKSMDNERQQIHSNNTSTNWFVPVPQAYSHPGRRSSFTTYESLVGNKLACTPPSAELNNSPADPSGFLTDSMFKYNAIPEDKLKLPEMESQTLQHLKGDWVAYWEHELGHGLTSSRPFDFKQIGLQCFTGHVGPVRSVQALENENSFVSGGKDKTVKLWTLRNTGSGSTRCTAQFTYLEHKRSVISASFVSSVKHVASCDGSVHVWDPVTGTQISQYEPGKAAGGVSAVHVLDNPLSTHYLVAATAESTIRFIDLRAAKLAHEFQLSTFPSNTLGSTVGIACGPNWLAVAHSVGVISTLDIRTGFHLAGWPCKGAEGELNQVLGYNDKALITCSTDGLLSLWKHDSAIPLCQSKISGDQQLCSMRLFNDSVVAATPGNKICTLEPDTQEAKFHCKMGEKLRADTCRGPLTSIDILPLNRQLLLGTDNGTIYLMA